MYIRAGLIALLHLLANCSGGGGSVVTIAPQAAREPLPQIKACPPDQPCTLTGMLTIERRSGDNSWAVLSQGDACAPLLLPSSIYQAWRFWNGKKVRVSGTALSRGPAAPPEILLLQYRDRWLSPSVCSASDSVLYVNTLAAIDGSEP